MTLTTDTVRLERRFDAAVDKVFDAWRSTEALQDWCCPGDNGWSGRVEAHDFAVGGTKRIVFGPEGEPPFTEDSHYLSIAPQAHIINSERILQGDRLVSVSKIVLEFEADGSGCRLKIADQITILSDEDSVDGRRHGWGEVLDKLGVFLET